MASDEYASEAKREERFKKVTTMVVEITQLLRAILLADDRNEVKYLRGDDKGETGYRIMMSICLLGEAITAALEAIYMDPTGPPSPALSAWPWGSRLLDFYLRHSGLCVFEADALVKNRGALHSTLMYSMLAAQFAPRLSHANCSEEECKAVPKPTGAPAHVEAGCKCNPVALSDRDRGELARLITKGTIPMLTVADLSTPLEPPTAELHVTGFNQADASSTHRCIAISHVWSDMLGNPLNNSMPACQLLKLQKTVTQLVKENWKSFNLGEDEVRSNAIPIGFWIDTICVPHDPQIKPLALTQMYDIYKSSSAVLVLDKRIQATDPDHGWHTCLWQIYSSTWGRRLWTLQEGILNKNTFFAFADDFWTAERLIRAISNLPFGLKRHADQVQRCFGQPSMIAAARKKDKDDRTVAGSSVSHDAMGAC